MSPLFDSNCGTMRRFNTLGTSALKEQIAQAIATAVEELVATGTIAVEYTGTIQVTRTKDSSHGDYSSNIALIFAKQAKQPPLELAQALCDSLGKLAQFEQVEVAGPGFINFFIAQKNQTKVIEKNYRRRSSIWI